MDRLLIHTCDVIEAGTKTSYGRPAGVDFENPTAVTTDVVCRWQPDEERNLTTGALLSSHLLVIPCEAAPSSLLAAAGAEAKHRIANVRRDGDLLDAGPFMVQAIGDAGGMGHHLELRLLRAN